MIGLGIALDDVAARQRHAGTSGPLQPVPAPAPAPASPPASAPASLAYMPALTTPGAAWHVLFSNERLLAGYDGPLALVGNGEGFAGTVPLGTGATGIAAADLPASVIALYGWFDQTGGGRHLSQDVLANRPRLRAEVTVGGRLATAFWGIENRAGACASLAGPQALAAGDRTEVWVVDPSYSIQNGVYAEHVQDGGAAIRLTFTAPASGGVLHAAGGAGDTVVAAQPQIWVVVDGPDGAALFVDGVKHPLPTGTGADAAIVRTTLGWSPAFGIVSTLNARIAAYGTIAGAVNDADALALTAALARRFGIVSGYALNLVHIGDSIVECLNASDTIGLKALMLPGIGAATRYMNLGISGKKQAACYADRATYEAALFVPGRRNVALIDTAINDLCYGSEGDALYAQVTVPYVAALAAMGYEVGVVTALPQDSTIYNVPVSAQVVEARREAYNAAVRANAAGATFVLDRATGAMGSFPGSCDDPALYPDALHPSTAGYALLAPVYAAAINARLAG